MCSRAWYIVAVLSAAVFLTAMGGGKGGSFTRAPRVEKSYAVKITDTSGKTITGEKFSWEGRIHFSGQLGMAQVVIPFDKVKDLTIGAKEGRKVTVTARLKDDKTTIFELDVDSRCYGEARFGSFMLMMDEIQKIVFQ